MKIAIKIVLPIENFVEIQTPLPALSELEMNEQLFHCKQGGTAVGRPCSNGAVFLFTKRRRMKMKKLSSSEIRQMYLDFFQEKGHKGATKVLA